MLRIHLQRAADEDGDVWRDHDAVQLGLGAGEPVVLRELGTRLRHVAGRNVSEEGEVHVPALAGRPHVLFVGHEPVGRSGNDGGFGDAWERQGGESGLLFDLATGAVDRGLVRFQLTADGDPQVEPLVENEKNRPTVAEVDARRERSPHVFPRLSAGWRSMGMRRNRIWLSSAITFSSRPFGDSAIFLSRKATAALSGTNAAQRSRYSPSVSGHDSPFSSLRMSI